MGRVVSPTPTPLSSGRVVLALVASYDMHGRAAGLFYTQPTGQYLISNRKLRGNSFQTITATFSVMAGTLVCVFGSCECHSKLTEEMYIPLVLVDVILDLQKRCTSLWFMWTSF